MNWKHYLIGLLSWALVSTIFTFTIILFGSDVANLSGVGIVTWRLFVLIFLCNSALNAILVKMNQ
jgi:hypothetical protein